MSEALMSQGPRLSLALLLIFIPFAAPVYVGSYGLSNAELSALPFIGAIVFASLVLVLAAAFIGEPVTDFTVVPRLMKIAFANLAFIFLTSQYL
jgi:hypothetical protein